MATIYQVSCSVDGSCGVQGSYADASQNTQLFVVNSHSVRRADDGVLGRAASRHGRRQERCRHRALERPG